MPALFALAAATECDDREGGLAVSQCWSAARDVAGIGSNAIRRHVAEKARASDRAFDPSSRQRRTGAMAGLLASQRAWLKLRMARCALDGDYAQGGSLEPVPSGRCYANMTRQRVKQLADIAEGFDVN